MRSCSLEVAARRLDDALGRWHQHGANRRVWWIGPGQVPLSQVAVRWPVGFQDEGPGELGHAHLAEHALFRGASGREGREDLLLAEGGLSNARTNARATMFWSAVSSERRAVAFGNEASRYVEPLDPDWVAHQALVVRAELLHKAKGSVEGYVRIRSAIEAGHATCDADGFGRDALVSGLACFEDFVRRVYRGAPTVALSGFPGSEVLALFDAEPLTSVEVRTSGPCTPDRVPAVGAGSVVVGRASLHPVGEHLGLVDRALLGAAARLLLPNAEGVQVRLHLWGDPVSETTTPPFMLMVESEDGAGSPTRDRLAALDSTSITRIVDLACKPAAARLSRLAAQLGGPWAAQTWSALLERTGDNGFTAPRPAAGTVDGARRRAIRLLSAVVNEELAA